MKEKFIKYYMDIAESTANLSYAQRLKVGSVIVKNNQIIGTGYNGTPAGWSNVCEDKEWCSAGGWLSPEEIEEGWPYKGEYLDQDGHPMKGRYRLKTKPEVIHSESNAILKVAKSTESTEGATMFCTHAPCLDCAKLIYQSGITQLYYRNQYRSDDGIDFLNKSNVEVIQYKS